MPTLTVSPGISNVIGLFSGQITGIFESGTVTDTDLSTFVTFSVPSDLGPSVVTLTGDLSVGLNGSVSGTMTGLTTIFAGSPAENITITGLSLDISTLQAAYDSEVTDPGAVEAILLPLGWDVTTNDNVDFLPEGSVNSDGVVLNFSGNDVFNLLGGDDEVWSGDGDDEIYGGKGNDTLSGGAGEDKVVGGKGDDELSGGEDKDVLIGGKGSDFMSGGGDNDRLVGGSGVDGLFGGDGRDNLKGGADNDFLWGEDQKDALYGGDGEDVLFGGSGKDKLFGGDGEDQLIGGTGSDVMTGGAGSDTFVFDLFVAPIDGPPVLGGGDFSANLGNDVITDYQIGMPEPAADGDAAPLDGFEFDQIIISGSGPITISAGGEFGQDTLVTYDGGTILLLGVLYGGQSAMELNISNGDDLF